MSTTINTPVDIAENNIIRYSIEADDNVDCHLSMGFMDILINSEDSEILLVEIHIWDLFRGAGFGTDSLKWLINFSRNFGAKSITLYVSYNNEKAQSLYKRLGFTYDDYIGDMCYKMTLVL